MAIAIGATRRGFAIGGFKDANGVECTIQKSSVATDDLLWVGCMEPNPKIMPGDGTGWHQYQFPENVHCTTRMHLTREMVADLLPHLQRFVDTGEL